ncbi:hypothetical protein [Saccharibacillus sacchari]|uniref:Uncharacterized protein n=1 Tax=Saccharibacillus sacchari TaxID=456493 RepID=A0ACC6PFE1_9BACL
MQKANSEDLIRIRVLPEEATEVAEWAGLMLSELVGDEVSGNGAPVTLRDPERAAELLELLMLCAEEGADAASTLAPAVSVLGAIPSETFEAPPANLNAFAAAPPYPDWHPYYGSDALTFMDEEKDDLPAYRSAEERDEVLMAVRFGASALIDLARSHGVDVPVSKTLLK